MTVTTEMSHTAREWIVGSMTGVVVCIGLLLWSLLIGSQFWENCTEKIGTSHIHLM